MDRETGRWIAMLLRPPLVALRFLLNAAFSAPFDMLDRRIAQENQKRLARDVQDALPFLFNELGGNLILTGCMPTPPAFDYACVTVALEVLLFRFNRGRGELVVNIAPSFASKDWHDLGLVLSAITGKTEIERVHFRDLWDVSRVLQPHTEALRAFFSLNRFESVTHRLEDEVYSRERVAIQAWQAEINRRLYGS